MLHVLYLITMEQKFLALTMMKIFTFLIQAILMGLISYIDLKVIETTIQVKLPLSMP